MDARLEADLVEAALQFPQQIRELQETLQSLRGNTHSASTINVHAGGITNAVAICVSFTAIVMFIVLAVWVSVQKANMESEQRAWVAVMQQKVIESKQAKE